MLPSSSSSLPPPPFYFELARPTEINASQNDVQCRNAQAKIGDEIEMKTKRKQLFQFDFN